MSGRRGQAGFTLIELLVAVSLFALLTAMLVGGFRFGARLWEQTDAGASGGAGTEAAYAFVRRSLASALPVEVEGRTGRDDVIAFSGGPSQLTFVGPAPAQAFVGGLYEITLTVVPRGYGVGLAMAIRPWRSGLNPAIAAQSERLEMLVDGAAAGEFLYLAPPRAGRGPPPSWRSDWVGRRDLPAMVAVRLTFPPGDRRIWPDLLVAPQVAQLS